MPTAQDHVFVRYARSQGALSSDAAAALSAMTTSRAPIPQQLMQQRLISPQVVAELLGRLNQAHYVCPQGHGQWSYQQLYAVETARCQACGQDLEIRAPDSPLLNSQSGSQVGYARPPSESTSTGPKAVGPYAIIRELGRGANGVVYLAQRGDVGVPCAVKVLLDPDEDPEGLARFRLEAAVASKLENPGIVRVFDIGQHGRLPYYAMEFCEGETLQERLRRGPLPVREAAEVVGKICDSIGEAHAREVLHRDLKPANVILEASTGHPKVTDFGLARDRSLLRSMTRTGDIMGTPYYMAPEVFRGSKHTDARADVYALGVMLYECLSGERPFQAPTPTDLARKVLHEDPTPLRKFVPDLDPDLEQVVLHAMAKDREDRPADARVLARALAPFRATAASKAPRKRARPRPAPKPRVNPLYVVGAALVSGVLGAGLWWLQASSSQHVAQELDTIQAALDADAPDLDAIDERLLALASDLRDDPALTERFEQARAAVDAAQLVERSAALRPLAVDGAAAEWAAAFAPLAEAADAHPRSKLAVERVRRDQLQLLNAAVIDQAHVVAPYDPDIEAALRTLEQLAEDDEVRLERRLERMDYLRRRGRDQQCQALAAEFLDRRDWYGAKGSYLSTASRFRAQGDWPRFVNRLNQIASYEDKNEYSLVAMSYVRTAQLFSGQAELTLDQVREPLERAKHSARDTHMPYLGLALLDQPLGQMESSITKLNNVLAEVPDETEALIGLSTAKAVLGDFRAAREIYETVAMLLDTDQISGRSYQELTMLSLQIYGRDDLVVSFAEFEDARDPSSPIMPLIQCMLALQTGDRAAMQRHFREAFRRDPQTVRSYVREHAPQMEMFAPMIVGPEWNADRESQ